MHKADQRHAVSFYYSHWLRRAFEAQAWSLIFVITHDALYVVRL